jgi:hypothetical protein
VLIGTKDNAWYSAGVLDKLAVLEGAVVGAGEAPLLFCCQQCHVLIGTKDNAWYSAGVLDKLAVLEGAVVGAGEAPLLFCCQQC